MVAFPPNPALAQFIKPTQDTLFHIDYSWWDKQGLDPNIKLLTHLCPEHRNAFGGQLVNEKIDWLDWETGKIKQVDGLQYVIKTHCSKEPGYVMQAPTLIEAIFRALLSKANEPLSPRMLSAMVGHPADQILRVLAGRRIRLGLRPVLNK
ncbi:MAG: hypothetical protein P1S60_13605 [Anaerolineae bacterium]|nr:hypothetical protein [Anaerolineae bacterium]